MMPGIHVKGNYIRERIRDPRAMARGSFRTLKRGTHRVIVACPKGSGNGRCKVSMVTQAILHPLSERSKLLKRRLNR